MGIDEMQKLRGGCFDLIPLPRAENKSRKLGGRRVVYGLLCLTIRQSDFGLRAYDGTLFIERYNMLSFYHY